MQRFNRSNLNTTNFTFILTDIQIIYQLTKVLRIKVWEKVVFLDGQNVKNVRNYLKGENYTGTVVQH